LSYGRNLALWSHSNQHSPFMHIFWSPGESGALAEETPCTKHTPSADEKGSQRVRFQCHSFRYGRNGRHFANHLDRSASCVISNGREPQAIRPCNERVGRSREFVFSGQLLAPNCRKRCH